VETLLTVIAEVRVRYRDQIFGGTSSEAREEKNRVIVFVGIKKKRPGCLKSTAAGPLVSRLRGLGLPVIVPPWYKKIVDGRDNSNRDVSDKAGLNNSASSR
jgi:hypothetical protein